MRIALVGIFRCLHPHVGITEGLARVAAVLAHTNRLFRAEYDLVTLLTTPAWADEGFTNRDFKGDYAFHLDGALTSPGAPVVAAYSAAIGRFTADGAGNITHGTRSLSVNGIIVKETFTCTYNVNPNGTAKATCAFSVRYIDFGHCPVG